jgi:hypothetical protein
MITEDQAEQAHIQEYEGVEFRTPVLVGSKPYSELTLDASCQIKLESISGVKFLVILKTFPNGTKLAFRETLVPIDNVKFIKRLVYQEERPAPVIVAVPDSSGLIVDTSGAGVPDVINVAAPQRISQGRPTAPPPKKAAPAPAADPRLAGTPDHQDELAKRGVRPS